MMSKPSDNRSLTELEHRLRDAEKPAEQEFRSLRTRVIRDAQTERDERRSRWKQTWILAATVLVAFSLGRLTTPQTVVEKHIVITKPDQTKTLEQVIEKNTPVEKLASNNTVKRSQPLVVRNQPDSSLSKEFVNVYDDITEEINKLRSHKRKILIDVQGRL